MLQYLSEVRRDDAGLLKLGEELDDLRRKLPEEVKVGPEALALDDVDYLRSVVGELEPLLVSQFQEENEQ